MRVTGRLDPAKVASAVRTAMDRHPITRARLLPGSDGRGSHRWEIPEEVEQWPFEVVDCPDEGALSRARDRILDVPPELDSPPPFRLMLAHHQGGDALILNINHAVTDGVGAFRFMTSVCRAYAGVPDPVPDIDPLEARDVHALVNLRSFRHRLQRTRARLRRLPQLRQPPAQLPELNKRTGATIKDLFLDGVEVRSLLAQRQEGASVNDLLLAGLSVAIRRWNDQHGVPPAPIALVIPVNLRPPEWRDQVLANLSAISFISVPPEAQTELKRAQLAIAPQTRRLKRERYTAVPQPGWMPSGLKRRLKTLLVRPPAPVAGSELDGEFVFTAALTNLGRAPALPQLGGASGEVSRMWIPQLRRPSSGIVVSVSSMNGRMIFTLRCRAEVLGGAAADEFASRLREAYVGSR
jgi:NRPS condensation-like uncharacterized protein